MASAQGDKRELGRGCRALRPTIFGGYLELHPRWGQIADASLRQTKTIGHVGNLEILYLVSLCGTPWITSGKELWSAPFGEKEVGINEADE